MKRGSRACKRYLIASLSWLHPILKSLLTKPFPRHVSTPQIKLLCCRAQAYHGSMRWALILVAMGLMLVESGGTVKSARLSKVMATASVSPSSTTKARVDFDSQLKPIFQSKCMPCHFSGGQMYDRLPFDKPATIRKLGTRLFTRIKEENDRRLIEDFLAQSP